MPPTRRTPKIRARVWTFEDEPVDKEFFRKKNTCVTRYTRYQLQLKHTSMQLDPFMQSQIASRLDRRPRMAMFLSSISPPEVNNWIETIADMLLEEKGLENIYERSDADAVNWRA